MPDRGIVVNNEHQHGCLLARILSPPRPLHSDSWPDAANRERPESRPALTLPAHVRRRQSIRVLVPARSVVSTYPPNAYTRPLFGQRVCVLHEVQVLYFATAALPASALPS